MPHPAARRRTHQRPRHGILRHRREAKRQALCRRSSAWGKACARLCRRCHPCPAGLDIALINKYYDLAQLGDKLAKEHYLTLEKTAGDCIGCGHCDSRFPFHVAQSERMQTIRAYFGA